MLNFFKNHFTKKPDTITKFLDCFINVILFLIFFSVPIFFTGQTVAGISFEKTIYFILLALLCLVAWAIKIGNKNFKNSFRLGRVGIFGSIGGFVVFFN
jgi:hypothetical protein